MYHGHPGSLKFETVGYGVTVHGTTETQELNVTGVSTFSGLVNANANITISNGQPTINLTDTDANSDYQVNVNTGIFYLADSTNNQTRFYLTSDGTGFFQNNFNLLFNFHI